MNCEKCRWSEHYYIPVNSTNLWRADCWFVSYTCLLGGCDGSQYEPKDGMDEVKE